MAGMRRTITFEPGNWTLPIDLGAVLDAEGSHALPVCGEVAKFDFGFRDIRFVGQVDPRPNGTHLKLVGDVGPMPFSAESLAARAGLARIIAASGDVLGGHPLRVNQGRILAGVEADLGQPITATALVAAVALFLVRLSPYLDLIAVYVRPPLASARPGEPAIRAEWRRAPGRQG
jgi:hypothetical protein